MFGLDRGFEEAAFGSGEEKDRILLEAVHNALTGVITRDRDLYDAMRSIPQNPKAPKLHQFGHAMLNRFDGVASAYSHLL